VRRNLAIALLALALSAEACAEGGGSSSPQTLTTSPTEAGGSSPTASAGITGSVSKGRATIRMTGEVEVSAGVPLASPAVYAPPPSGFALSWSDGGRNILTLGGTAFTGTLRTSPTLRLSVTVKTGAVKLRFVSTDGRCEITVTEAGPSAFSGTYACADVRATDGSVTVDATGSFIASG
jgi:hypothetical protein